MSDSAVLTLLAGAGVISVLLFAVRGILEQLPDVLRSWQRVRKAWRDAASDDDQSAP
ncbi:hypothetical protein SHJG_p1141 (plasmid) [Streptomyces hygroscopicus subsp. jinggangensis 5008]|nr:hypothetical protein SHJG_p1141 [Streptomyces hygroscopicus subsp. jinggangensis 5008]AGF68426.1 hypothetical protein SHJGH_p1141 [Streptomyces hygroscopicus subsp. jinggangensis TL01]